MQYARNSRETGDLSLFFLPWLSPRSPLETTCWHCLVYSRSKTLIKRGNCAPSMDELHKQRVYFAASSSAFVRIHPLILQILVYTLAFPCMHIHFPSKVCGTFERYVRFKIGRIERVGKVVPSARARKNRSSVNDYIYIYIYMCVCVCVCV